MTKLTKHIMLMLFNLTNRCNCDKMNMLQISDLKKLHVIYIWVRCYYQNCFVHITSV